MPRLRFASIYHLLWLGMLLCVPACAGPVPDSPPAEQDQPAERYAVPAIEREAHLANLGVLRWHDRTGKGKGVTIAVLDSGFRDYASFLGKGLPSYVKMRSFRRDCNLEARDSQHGIACAEVLHALAPDAGIMLINWQPDSPQSFLDAVRWAKAEGAKIITCSLIMPSWSDGEGGGEIHRGLAQILGDGNSTRDVLFFASAGNTAQRHWCGRFDPDETGWHQWREGAVVNTLTPFNTQDVAVNLYGPTKSALELSIYHAGSGARISRSVLRADSTQACGHAVVRFKPAADATYQVKVRSLDEAPQAAFHVAALGATLQTTSSRGSIPFPGDGANVLAVGAVDGSGRRHYYSSCGPNSRVPKPDFVAQVPFPSACRSKPFSGTSAAAPQAAALAALLWSSRPSWTPHQIKQALQRAAFDLGPPGHDHETGYGLVRLPR